jgi:hypothetical protein
MRRTVMYVAIIGGAAWLYDYVLGQAFVYLPIPILTPTFLHTTRQIGGHVLLRAVYFGLDIVISFIVAIPFAILIAKLYGRRWLPAAVAIGFWPVFEEWAGFPKVWSSISDHNGLVTGLAVDTLRMLLMLPLLTYFARRMASNNRMGHDGEG